MTEPTDRAGLLLQRVSELLFECRAVAQKLETAPDADEPSGASAERIAYGLVMAAPEEGLVKKGATWTPSLG